MRLYLIRHGQAQWQVGREGDLDSPLTPLGHRQSSATAGFLAARLAEGTHLRDVAALFTSPLIRARETSVYLEQALGMQAELVPELQEAKFRLRPILAKRAYPLGEVTTDLSAPYKAFAGQVFAALEGIVARSYPSRTAIAVTHGGVIKTVLRILAGSSSICYEISNASLTVLAWSDGIWTLEQLAAAGHIPSRLRSC